MHVCDKRTGKTNVQTKCSNACDTNVKMRQTTQRCKQKLNWKSHECTHHCAQQHERHLLLRQQLMQCNGDILLRTRTRTRLTSMHDCSVSYVCERSTLDVDAQRDGFDRTSRHRHVMQRHQHLCWRLPRTAMMSITLHCDHSPLARRRALLCATVDARRSSQTPATVRAVLASVTAAAACQSQPTPTTTHNTHIMHSHQHSLTLTGTKNRASFVAA